MNPNLDSEKKLPESMNETSSNLSNKDDREEESVGVDQTFALLPRPAAAHESHNKDHAADDHQEDWRVHIVVSQEVKVVLGINLRPGTEADENTPSENEEDVEEDHEVFHEAFATVLHDEAGRMGSEKGIKCKCWWSLATDGLINHFGICLVIANVFSQINLLSTVSVSSLLFGNCAALKMANAARNFHYKASTRQSFT